MRFFKRVLRALYFKRSESFIFIIQKCLLVLSDAALFISIYLGRQLTYWRMRRGKLRALWGVTPILTLPLKARAASAIGIESETLVFTNYYITNDFDWNLKWLIERWLVPGLEQPFYRFLLAVCLLRYDFFHYFADHGILPPLAGRFGIHPLERDALQKSGKRLYVFAYGADVRTRERTLSLGKWNFCRDCSDPGRFCLCNDEAGQALLKETSESATAMVALGDMLAYVPTAYHVAYWPVDHERIAYAGVERSRGPLKIAHAPNHTHFKGTRYLERALKTLRAQGLDFELVILSGVSNTDVLRLLAKADIVADQFIGGAYGYTALEGMACGKPVLTYVRSRDLIIAPEECPLINATPDTLCQVLEWCASHRELLSLIGRQGRSYVARHHSISAVAARFADLYMETADIPDRLSKQFEAFISEEKALKSAIPTYEDWRHPWGVVEGRSAC